ncbi:multiple sugar transport system substrate-binding protein [Microbacterium trichothecenolyticum]|uniref:ABC transporter substrate-binding protein n=1 Tax=Microbacterium trichothecenolyticum TaxID=69370 RepID=UPI0028656A62|nr:sugar ABC transporter substrate-binding protein [Microbacterium trichothecenolyticum]MDR7184589.1 multiple sugar transport system substrate-binding protein [Microbacterium trichothecenolyticum]
MNRKAIMGTGALALVGVLALTSCSGGGTPDADAAESRGDITLWYSNVPEEKVWAEAVMEAWNADHPDEQVSGEALPQTSDSNAAVQAAIVAGNVPCLVYNMDGAGIQQFVATGGVVNLSETFDDADEFIVDRTGEARADGYTFDDQFYAVPWKSNPDMVLYNKDVFAAAGLDPEDPGITNYTEFAAAANQLVDSGAADYALTLGTGGEYFWNWWDWYPLFIAATGGEQAVVDGEPQFGSPEGVAAGELLRTLVEDGVIPKQIPPNTWPFGEGNAGMFITGSYTVSALRDSEAVPNLGAFPVPLPDDSTEGDVWTFADAKEVSLFSNCENQATAWDFLKFSMSEENDLALLEAAWQIPLREGMADLDNEVFQEQPVVKVFAEQAERTTDVPVTPNGVAVWQAFRDNFVKAVFNQTVAVEDAFTTADEAARPLLAE